MSRNAEYQEWDRGGPNVKNPVTNEAGRMPQNAEHTHTGGKNIEVTPASEFFYVD